MRSLFEQRLLERLCCTRRHRENRPVQAASVIAILDRQAIDLGAKYAQSPPRSIRRQHRHCAQSSSNYSLTVSGSDHIFHRHSRNLGPGPGMNKAQLSIFDGQDSCALVFNAVKTDYRCAFYRPLLLWCDGRRITALSLIGWSTLRFGADCSDLIWGAGL